MTKQAESCKTRSLRARKAVRKPPETVRKRNRLASPPRLPATRKAFSDSETAVPCSETAPSGGAFFTIFILQITIFPLTTALPQKSKENVEHSKLDRRKATIQRNGIYRPGWGNDMIPYRLSGCCNAGSDMVANCARQVCDSRKLSCFRP